MKRSQQRTLFESTPHDAAAVAELEQIRTSIQAGNVSYWEISRLQTDLTAHIAPEDTELLQWANVDEFD